MPKVLTHVVFKQVIPPKGASWWIPNSTRCGSLEGVNVCPSQDATHLLINKERSIEL